MEKKMALKVYIVENTMAKAWKSNGHLIIGATASTSVSADGHGLLEMIILR